ncbi:PAP2 family protein [Vibrio pectenicida]|uniref:PAP2 family protein n=2 Tax=Vibrio pectenicida TaxID=62763 RepID=A0A3R9EGW5_9VIBR|nr:PAP2 family protein [Vibrio pectenicida]
MQPIMQITYRPQWQQLKIAFYQDRILYIYVLITTLLVYLLSSMFLDNQSLKFDPFIYLDMLIQVCYISFLIWATGFYLFLAYNRTPHPLHHFVKAIKSSINPSHKALSFIFLILALNFTFSSYTFIKPLIPQINPFQYDRLFHQLDQWLHLGYTPWQITHYIFSSAIATSILNILYHLWFLLKWGAILFFIVRRDLIQLRVQFLLTFLSSWLLIGGLGAIALSAAGPCYLHLLDPDALYYQPLMQRLIEQNHELTQLGWFRVWVLDVQDTLWQMHISQQQSIGGGISAMPSMHVSIAVLMALAAYRYNKRLGLVMWLYAITIQIGSVHLAWHYAVDGYFSAIFTVCLWKGIGWIQNHFGQSNKV